MVNCPMGQHIPQKMKCSEAPLNKTWWDILLNYCCQLTSSSSWGFRLTNSPCASMTHYLSLSVLLKCELQLNGMQATDLLLPLQTKGPQGTPACPS